MFSGKMNQMVPNVFINRDGLQLWMYQGIKINLFVQFGSIVTSSYRAITH